MDNLKTSSKGFNLPGMKRKPSDPNKKELRLPFIGFLPNKIRNHFIAASGEFVGTFCFLFLAFSATQVANTQTAGSSAKPSQLPNTSVLLYISLAFGFSLAVNAWVFFRISGGASISENRRRQYLLTGPRTQVSSIPPSHSPWPLLAALHGSEQASPSLLSY